MQFLIQSIGSVVTFDDVTVGVMCCDVAATSGRK